MQALLVLMKGTVSAAAAAACVCMVCVFFFFYFRQGMLPPSELLLLVEGCEGGPLV